MTGGVIKKSTKKPIRITDIFEYLDLPAFGTQYEERFETWANHLRSFNYDIWFIKRNDIRNLAPLMKAVNNRA